MSGKLCTGTTQNNSGISNLSESKAYCEGRQAASEGVLDGDNPHVAGSPAAISWSTGHATWFNDPALGNPRGRDCCAVAFGGGYVP